MSNITIIERRNKSYIVNKLNQNPADGDEIFAYYQPTVTPEYNTRFIDNRKFWECQSTSNYFSSGSTIFTIIFKTYTLI